MRALHGRATFGWVETTPAINAALTSQRWRRAVGYLSIGALLVALIEGLPNGPAGLIVPLLAGPAAVFLAHGFGLRLPWIVLAALTVGPPSVLYFLDEAEGGMFFLVLYALAFTYEIGNRRVASIVSFSLASIPILALITTQPQAAWGFWSIGIVLGWYMGQLGSENRSLLAQLQASRAAATDQAVLAERRRIARDIHDLVGHSLTVVLLHITGARRAVRRDPASAEAALTSAEQVGRDSLAEIRRSVTLLRTDGSGTHPSPDASDIAQLIEDSRGAGQRITFDAYGDLATVDGAVGLTAYRLVQESLANAAKHSPGQPVTVELGAGETACNIVVENQRAARPNALTASGGGFGLISMRERVQAVRGTLVIGPAGPVWRVEASLPLSRFIPPVDPILS